VEAMILADATLWWLVSPGVRVQAGDDGCLTVTFEDVLYGDGRAEVVGAAVPSGGGLVPGVLLVPGADQRDGRGPVLLLPRPPGGRPMIIPHRHDPVARSAAQPGPAAGWELGAGQKGDGWGAWPQDREAREFPSPWAGGNDTPELTSAVWSTLTEDPAKRCRAPP
jgi:hypothetical protein